MEKHQRRAALIFNFRKLLVFWVLSGVALAPVDRVASERASGEVVLSTVHRELNAINLDSKALD